MGKTNDSMYQLKLAIIKVTNISLSVVICFYKTIHFN